MSTSFQEAVEAVAKRRKISEDESALIVAEEYASVASIEEAEPDDTLLDNEDEAELWLRDHTRRAPRRVVKVDEDRSPAGTIQAQADRMQARREGERYRELSRRASLHLGMDR